jgi:hypothetical protein
LTRLYRPQQSVVRLSGASFISRVSCLLFSSIALIGALSSSALAASLETRFEKGKLWVSAHEVAAPDLFAAVAAKTGVRFVIDSELRPGPMTVDIDGADLERAIRMLVAGVPGAAGHAVAYHAGRPSRPKEVSIFGAGKAPSQMSADVYEAANPEPTPDLEKQQREMVQAGVAPKTAASIKTLDKAILGLGSTPEPGSYRPEDLSPDLREKIPSLLEYGYTLEQAVQQLTIQQEYRETMKDLTGQDGMQSLLGAVVPPPWAPAWKPPWTAPPAVPERSDQPSGKK